MNSSAQAWAIGRTVVDPTILISFACANTAEAILKISKGTKIILENLIKGSPLYEFFTDMFHSKGGSLKGNKRLIKKSLKKEKNKKGQPWLTRVAPFWAYR